MNLLANCLTSLSLFFGFVSIIFSLEAHFTFASWAIILSVIFDGLDGQVARRNPRPNDFGKELDSLVDAVAFGIAPSILGYRFVYRDFHFWATSVLFIYLACSIIRLAKYNITPQEELSFYFYGLPTTISGGVVASFILIYRKYASPVPPKAFLFLVLLLALLMVSRIKYFNLDGVKKALGRALLPVSLTILIISAFFAEITIFALFVIYLLFSPFAIKRIIPPR